jgi:hypothetical protein
MTVSIASSSSSSVQPGTVAPSTSNVPPPAPVQKSVEAAQDSVKLSQAAQIHLFKQQGESPSQIAANLGISTASVDGYLGIAVAKAISGPAPVQAPDPAANSSAKPTPIPTKS